MDTKEEMDPITKLNTELNRSMTLTDKGSSKNPSRSKKCKSIILDNATTSDALITSTPGPSNLSDSISPKKSILKEPTDNDELDNTFVQIVNKDQETQEETPVETEQVVKRPQNLEEFMETESLEINTTPCVLNVPDISEDDALWLFDVPRTIDPRDFEGQMLDFYGKSKLKAGGEKYVAVPHITSDYFTCVLGTGIHDKPWQAINITPQGSIIVRKKISGWVKKSCDSSEVTPANSRVPFPKTLKNRHPLLGVILREKKKKKRSKLL
ncbi:uncharacterized protein [Chelonus insularis]|uniref:uncharacterized protein n=1 Tax=Chelonus insularis TaxID=460826 RepID=UPI00158B823F|nr:uncharacterized protein LOC118073067 [Chelonus insularis]